MTIQAFATRQADDTKIATDISQGFAATPLTSSCARVASHADHVVLGISPFNSYYRTERIVGLIDWARHHVASMDFFVPDMAAAYTLQAQGYEPTKAARKAREQAKYVHNKIRTAMHDAEYDGHERIWGLGALAENARYNELHAEAQERFASDSELAAEMMSTSSWILAGKLSPGERPTPEQVRLAVQYFLAEVPLFIDSPGIFGVPSSLFVYHQRVDFLERLYNHELSWKPVDGQGFLVVQPEDEADIALPA